MSLGGNNYVTAGNFLWRISTTGDKPPETVLSSGPLAFANNFARTTAPKTKRVAGYPETSGHRQLFLII